MWPPTLLFFFCSFFLCRQEAIALELQGFGCTADSCRASIQSVRPVCGSDSFTYPNKCILQLAQCYDKTLTQLNKGPCRTHTPCTEYNKTSPNSILNPHCRADGNYASGQCSSILGYCWCVNSHGVPLDYTMSQYSPEQKQTCARKKKNNKRRSSSRNGRRLNQPCKREDKAKFNLNLIKIFQTEWNRDGGKGTSTSSSSTDDDFRTVLDWKFKQMDRNNDDQLDKTEYRDLKKIVKKAVKPKRCAKSFAKACDMNRDQLIGREEWADCLTKDGRDDGSPGSDNTSSGDSDREDLITTPSSTLTPPYVLKPFIPDEESSEPSDEDAVDCRSDRQTALSEMSNEHSKNDLYVPECTSDGRYQKIQCYKSTGYCWCVHEDTGKTIAGTTVLNATPKCDQIAPPIGILKGCPEDRKKEFLRGLIRFLHDKMDRELNGSSIASANRPAWNTTKEEQVASWSFVIFDKNKNKIFEKHEWKFFKDTIAAVRSLRRCGKKLPRYCDKNNDRGITMTEWLECLQRRDPAFMEILRED
ncbi:SPARC-related modular calcium-binding protein 2 isoform X2 [Onthophagus taurus]|uniref:SPARC-related modular calcium-binding protein 2 isoform X2 n=1 Tax=Onthophagus taurus TaxID=166361 RepID=UPI000C20D840|nr:SPARC-related modular calcium-binding protein 1 isoform X2 [Onthophagus taurus]